jgi:hypothetical protein
MSKWIVVFLVLAIPASFPAWARPVSYPGGWTFITENDGSNNTAVTHYTVDRHTAVGYRLDYDRDTQKTFHGFQMNNLLKRWNNPDSQANIYLKSAVGFRDGEAEGFTGTQMDWEDRRFMLMYENMGMVSGEEEQREFHQKFGLGIAPYVAEFGSLHTWFMFHAVHEPESDKNWQFESMLRFFKGTVLIEAGYNFTMDQPMANAMIRF